MKEGGREGVSKAAGEGGRDEGTKGGRGKEIQAE